MTKDEYLVKLLEEIAQAKAQHRNGVFKMNEKIPDDVAKHARDFLIANTKHRIEFRKCLTCRRTWDVIIIF
jgi:hypothetical protein